MTTPGTPGSPGGPVAGDDPFSALEAALDPRKPPPEDAPEEAAREAPEAGGDEDASEDAPREDAPEEAAPAGRAASRSERRRKARRSPRAAGGEARALQRIRGRRSARLVADRRRRRSRRRGLVAAALLAAVAVAALAVMWSRQEEAPAPVAGEDPVPLAGEDSYTLLLVRHGEDGGGARSVTLLAGGAADGPALVLFLPVGTLVDTPGVGMDRLGLAYQYGGAPLVQAAVENVLGVAVDHTAVVSDSGLGALLDRVGGMRVEVPGRLVVWREDGTAEVRFEPGEQFLDGARLAEYWGFRARGEDELATLTRQQRVLDGLFEASTDPEVAEGLLGDGAPQLETAADADWLSELIDRLAQARGEGELRFALLPVEPFGGEGPDGGATYRLREAALDEMTQGVLAATVPGDRSDVLRVQVLNGVGVPGVGQRVDERLDRGFRIVVTDNARNFDFSETQILVYDETPGSLEAARRVQEQLGVGRIQVSRQPQSVVDLTIVVGADFVTAATGGDGDGA